MEVWGKGVLGGQPQQAVNELDLGRDSTCLNLSLPNHVHRLVAPQGSPGRLVREKPQPRFHPPFDEPVVLLDQVVQALHWPELAPLG